MSAVGGISGHGASALHALQQLGARTSALIDRVSDPGTTGDVTNFAAAVTEMNEVRLQTKAAIAVLRTSNSLAEELLSLPRR